MTNIIYPIPPKEEGKTLEMDIYVRFMRHLRLIPHNRDEIKILSSIQFVSDMTGSSEAHVSKVLADLGLKASRLAFPAEFLDYADASMMRQGYEYGAPSQSTKDLVDHWVTIGEDQFAGFKRQYSLVDEEFYLGVNH
jgi:hypothetical protein